MLVLVAGSRLTASMHYCAGKLISVEFFKDSEACKKCGSKAKKHTCCQDITQSVSSEDFKSQHFHFDFLSHVAVVPATFFLFECANLLAVVNLQHIVEGNAPPTSYKEPFFILYRSLIV